jgi:DNA-binding NarL/FixJ family response regulator
MRDSTPSATAPVFPDLTERQRDLLGLIAQGLTNSAIAEQLALSPKTVRNYITEIFSKLQVADRAQAIIRARNAGLG